METATKIARLMRNDALAMKPALGLTKQVQRFLADKFHKSYCKSKIIMRQPNQIIVASLGSR